MIHIVIGTKAQLIKMLGIIKELEKRGIDFNYIDTGQHSGITPHLRKDFKIKEPDYFLSRSKTVVSNKQGIAWMMKVLFNGIKNRKKVFKGDKNGLCLVHGDTVSTLLGAIIGKLAGQRIVHVEAGFRSGNLLRPFPEEISRILVDKLSFINFSHGDISTNNLLKKKRKSIIKDTKINPLIDAVRYAKKAKSEAELPEKFILVSIHRFETIHSKKRMEFITKNVQKLSQTNKIVWGLHTPTKNALKKFNLLKSLEENKNITLRGLFDYKDFIYAISRSDFLITDGGGPQEETKYLNVPCLLMRSETENPHHKHILQASFEQEKVDYFINNIEEFKIESKTDKNFSPSTLIVDTLVEKQ